MRAGPREPADLVPLVPIITSNKQIDLGWIGLALLGYGTTVGALNAESLKRTSSTNFKKQVGSRNKSFFLWICAIFCMSEAVYISSGVRMHAGPLGP